MNISIGCPAALTSAQPGWNVRRTDSDGGGEDYPIAAWAIVTVGFEEDGSTGTQVQPVFIADGHTWTIVEWYAAYGEDDLLAVVEP
ncbi:hypothetical protein PUR59_30485 [Streptomyces sp. SP18ES09]|uniref:hypothetical protein n=1 Tax=Streptomyces sp. SP18ES09 TaxID=3002532 RepID=UPI002E75BC4A|nr:hypothetical protein [Streptomyces sp. SP18ES09]MEE1819329.1 hypothetical protein [Streptomyces sp. SP18ES09]